MTISRNLSILAEGVSSSGVLAVTNGGTGVTTSTGSGSNVLSASPTLTGTLTVPTVTSPAATALTIQSAGSMAITIDASQNVLVGTTSQSNAEKFNVTGSSASFITRMFNSNASPGGFLVNYSAVSPNAAGNAMLYCSDSTALRFAVQSNGGVYNYSANNSNLSDQRMKKDIQLAGLYLDKICAIPVKTFLYNDQTDTELNLGVIAQDVDAVAPELVDHDGWKDKDGEPTGYLSIYQTDLQYALMKCIQELSAKNDALTARIAALEAK
jgi:hypothetical protein